MIDRTTRSQPEKSSLGLYAAAFVLLGVVAATAIIAYEWPGKPAPDRNLELAEYPAVQRPDVESAADAGLPDETPVIGVTAGGRHRAYVLSALLPVSEHVINDVLGGRPVTVAYCDRIDLVRAFTSAESDPLDVSVGGWVGRYDHGCLLLQVGSVRYRLDDGAAVQGGESRFPYPDIAHVRTTWGEWRATHPDTDVYVGSPSADEPAG